MAVQHFPLEKLSREEATYGSSQCRLLLKIMVREITSVEEFEAAIAEAGGNLVVVDFFATWCGPCKRIAPAFAEFESVFDGLTTLKVDVDEVAELTDRFDVRAMPTFKFLQNGKEVGEFKGADLKGLTDKITELLAAASAKDDEAKTAE